MKHMRLETKVILPAARKHLTAEDWTEIDNAFARQRRPALSVDDDEEFRAAVRAHPQSLPEKVVGGTVGS